MPGLCVVATKKLLPQRGFLYLQTTLQLETNVFIAIRNFHLHPSIYSHPLLRTYTIIVHSCIQGNNAKESRGMGQTGELCRCTAGGGERITKNENPVNKGDQEDIIHSLNQ